MSFLFFPHLQTELSLRGKPDCEQIRSNNWHPNLLLQLNLTKQNKKTKKTEKETRRKNKKQKTKNKKQNKKQETKQKTRNKTKNKRIKNKNKHTKNRKQKTNIQKKQKQKTKKQKTKKTPIMIRVSIAPHFSLPEEIFDCNKTVFRRFFFSIKEHFFRETM